MPYVERYKSGGIKGIYAQEQSYAQEYLPEDSEQVLDYLSGIALVQAKAAAKQRVMRSKLAEVCAVEFAAIDKCTTCAEVDKF